MEQKPISISMDRWVSILSAIVALFAIVGGIVTYIAQIDELKYQANMETAEIKDLQTRLDSVDDQIDESKDQIIRLDERQKAKFRN